MNTIKLLNGDCLDKLKELKDNSVDSVVTDPPYEIGFMGKGWDDSGIANNPELWKEVLRVLKPGGHLLSFSHSRTYHRQAFAVEEAGFEIRDQIMWIYGSGFPKSHNIGKAVDKLQGNEREVVGVNKNITSTQENWQSNSMTGHISNTDKTLTKGNSPYEGWGTALKPAHEPIVMARKPFKGTVANNVLEWGTGGINIDGCRVGSEEININGGGKKWRNNGAYTEDVEPINETREGRFPANFIHGGIEEDWARYFYCPKASKKDRDEGMEHLQSKTIKGRDEGQDKTNIAYKARPTERKNIHPTVKPTALMAYLVRLVTPKGGVVLDPFMGSGSTGKACVREGMDFIGIEREDEYMEIAKSRIEHEQGKHNHRKFFDI